MKKIAIGLLVALMLASFLSVGVSAAETETRVHSILEGAVEHNGNYYLLVGGEFTWDAAKQYCEALGGHLATVSSAGEDDVCYTLWKESGKEGCWLGATDSALEGVWEWVTGEPWVYGNFGDSEPNGGTRENALNYYSVYENGRWNDVAAGEAFSFICEWEAEDVEYARENIGYVTSPGAIYNNALYFEGHLYKVFTHETAAVGALDYCERLGGHTVAINSQAENAILYRYACAMGKPNCMLGGGDAETEGLWFWSTGDAFTYSNWNAGEPNDSGDEDRLCFTVDGKWNDNDWVASYGFLCEWEEPCISADGLLAEAHSFGEGQVLLPATCENEGTVGYTCDNCGASKTETLATLPHEYGAWAVKTPATCNGDGVRAKDCNFCEASEEEPIAQLTHIYSEYEVVRGSVLIPPIVKEKTCELCHDVQTQEDWSYVWVTVLAAIAAVGIVIGVIGYIRAFKNK